MINECENILYKYIKNDATDRDEYIVEFLRDIGDMRESDLKEYLVSHFKFLPYKKLQREMKKFIIKLEERRI